MKKLTDERQQRKELCESSLEEFIKFVHPRRCLGSIHRKIIGWWTRQEAKSHQLLLLPRDHMKSTLLAYRLAWELTKNPTLRILLISSTSYLATKQLKFIKDILTSDNYRLLWPEMVNKEEALREKWTEREISIDHPLRKQWSIRDPSIFTAGLTSNIVGLHFDFVGLDDVVVEANAYIEAGREKVRTQYGYLSSVEATNAIELVVGTRYHPKDLYSDLSSMELEEYDELGNVSKRTPLFETIQEQVESVGDGTGQFLWPRQIGTDGKWFGFDSDILSEKRSKYVNKVHFRAQYYNDPHDVDSSPIKRDQFQYYDPVFVNRKDGRWYFKGQRINVCAAVDFAYSEGLKADYTAIVVIGMDSDRNYYILDIDRFKTKGLPSDYYKHIFNLYEKWGFRKIRAEVSVAQKSIVEGLKNDYIKPNGLALSVEEFRPSRWQGSKEERIFSVLQPKYDNRQIWHYVGGHCQSLEEELIFTNPPHDDIKDALASAVDFALPPSNLFNIGGSQKEPSFQYHAKFGGVI